MRTSSGFYPALDLQIEALVAKAGQAGLAEWKKDGCEPGFVGFGKDFKLLMLTKMAKLTTMGSLSKDKEYEAFLLDIKNRIHSAQYNAAKSVNSELMGLYWEIGQKIVQKQEESKWGDSAVEMLAADLTRTFPSMTGFSRSNVFRMRGWYLFYHLADPKVAQAVRQIPWGHNLAIMSKASGLQEAEFYVSKTLENGWSRNVLVHQIESGLYERQGKVTSNFTKALSSPQSEMAQESIKDPYVFDFLNLSERAREAEVEEKLIDNIAKFLLELGSGFAYVGRQYPLEVSGKDYRLDLLFYHLKLRCFVVVELKAGDFKPEYAGKMNFYLSAVDSTLRTDADQSTIGIILCKNKDRIVAEYALRGLVRPIGVSEYKLQKALPKGLQPSLPTPAELERGLRRKKGA